MLVPYFDYGDIFLANINLKTIDDFKQLQKRALRVCLALDGRSNVNDLIVGSAKVNFLSYRYRADKSTIFGMRGLWGLTINSGRGAT